MKQIFFIFRKVLVHPIVHRCLCTNPTLSYGVWPLMGVLSALSLDTIRVLPLFDLVLAALVLVPSGLGVVTFGC